MKLGVLTVLYQDLPLEQMLDKVCALGLEAIEVGTGNYPGNAHCDPEALLADPVKARAFKHAIESRGLILSALSQHGNPLHPNPDVARAAHETWRKTVELANVLEVSVVNAFPGCPGDPHGGGSPNWVTCAWPPDYQETLDWQWNERVIPYWMDEAKFAAENGVQIGFEMHPGFVVYNPETLLRLRAAAGPAVACNFDPSHLVWQGIDPIEALKLLGRAGAIVHVHAKETYLDPANIRLNGVLDTKPYGQVLDRSWTFRTVGYGSGEKLWRDLVSTLRAIGYDFVLSIEHEDALASVDEGVGKATALLQRVLFSEPAGEMFWA